MKANLCRSRSVSIVIFALILLTVTASDSAAEWFSEQIQQMIKKELVGQEISILPYLNKADVAYGRSGNIKFYTIREHGRPLLCQNKEVRATIREIDFDLNTVTLKLFSPKLGGGWIKFRFQAKILKEIAFEQLRDILANFSSDKRHLNVYCEKDNHICHLFASNHLTEGDIVLGADALQKGGYIPCHYCFVQPFYLPDSQFEQNLVHRLQYENQYLVLQDTQKEKRINEIVRKILGSWPLKLIGYNYKVKLIKSDVPKCTGLAGLILISPGLIDSMSNEEELEAVLVKTLAHIELRHATRQYMMVMQALQTAQVTGAMGVAMGAAGAARQDRGGAVLSAGSAAFVATAVISLINAMEYPGELDKEANSIVDLYFSIKGKSRENIYRYLMKEESVNLLTKKKTNVYKFESGDPYEEAEIERIRKTKIKYFGKDKSYISKNKDNVPFQLNLFYYEWSPDENRIMIYINDYAIIAVDLNEAEREIFLRVYDENDVLYQFIIDKEVPVRDQSGVYLIGRFNTSDLSAFSREKEFQRVKKVDLLVQNKERHSNQGNISTDMFVYRCTEGKIEF